MTNDNTPQVEPEDGESLGDIIRKAIAPETVTIAGVHLDRSEGPAVVEAVADDGRTFRLQFSYDVAEGLLLVTQGAVNAMQQWRMRNSLPLASQRFKDLGVDSTSFVDVKAYFDAEDVGQGPGGVVQVMTRDAAEAPPRTTNIQGSVDQLEWLAITITELTSEIRRRLRSLN